MAEEKTPQEQIREAIWTYTGWVVVVLVCIGVGVFIGYTWWGDAPVLKQDLTRAERRINDLKNERESLQTQIAMATRDRDECRNQLSQAAAAEAAPAEEAGEEAGGGAEEAPAAP